MSTALMLLSDAVYPATVFEIKGGGYGRRFTPPLLPWQVDSYMEFEHEDSWIDDSDCGFPTLYEDGRFRCHLFEAQACSGYNEFDMAEFGKVQWSCPCRSDWSTVTLTEG